MARFVVEIDEKSPLNKREGKEVADDIKSQLQDCLNITGLGPEESSANSKLRFKVKVTFEPNK